MSMFYKKNLIKKFNDINQLNHKNCIKDWIMIF